MSDEDELISGMRVISAELLADLEGGLSDALFAEMQGKGWRLLPAAEIWACPSEYKKMVAMLG